MYEEIEMIIFKKKLSKSDIAKKIGMTYNTFLLKLRGKNKFTLDEAIKLKNALDSDKPIEELFNYTDAA